MVLVLTWYLGQHSYLILTDTGNVVNRLQKESRSSDTAEAFDRDESTTEIVYLYYDDETTTTESYYYYYEDQSTVDVQCADATTYSLGGGGDMYNISDTE